MSQRKQIIHTALDWVGTPYHHHARVKQCGVDCAQLIVACALEAGLLTLERAQLIPNYPVHWHLHNREEKLIEQLESFGCTIKDKADLQPGDIVTFKYGRATSHLGVMINSTQFVHARWDMKKVVVNDFNGDFIDRWTFVYAFPEVNNV